MLHLGISDHCLVYAVRKLELPKSRPSIKEIRDFKYFSDSDFRADLMQVPWDTICYDDPNTCWIVWKSFFNEILNKHAPMCQRRLKAKSVPWITPAIKQLMRNRDYHKKKAIRYNSSIHWDKYKSIRNRVNNQMRKSKTDFYHKEIGNCAKLKDLKKTWSLINSLTGKNNKSTSITEILVNSNSVSDSKLIAESFNEYFVNIGPNLVTEASEEVLAQHTSSYENSNPSLDTTFRFS